MEILLRIFVLFFVFVNFSYAIEYKDIREISLKKDVQKKILVKYDAGVRVFKFRWTLYVNEGLVVFHSYDKIVSQHILYLNHINQSFILYLQEPGTSLHVRPYVLVKFKKFDFKKNIATFELFLYDKSSKVQMQYLKNDE